MGGSAAFWRLLHVEDGGMKGELGGRLGSSKRAGGRDARREIRSGRTGGAHRRVVAARRLQQRMHRRCRRRWRRAQPRAAPLLATGTAQRPLEWICLVSPRLGRHLVLGRCGPELEHDGEGRK